MKNNDKDRLATGLLPVRTGSGRRSFLLKPFPGFIPLDIDPQGCVHLLRQHAQGGFHFSALRRLCLFAAENSVYPGPSAVKHFVL